MEEKITYQNRSIVVVAGGKGSRMQSDIPKQFLHLAGKPLLMHTLSQCAAVVGVEKLVLVLPESHMDYWQELCAAYSFGIHHILVAGGPTRTDSVAHGVEALAGEVTLVAVHDGARPLISPEVIDGAFRLAATAGNAVVAVKAKDSIRYYDGHRTEALDRSHIYQVQTPQIFSTSPLLEALQNRDASKAYTDEASLMEALGHKIHLYEGDYRNIKVTTPEDLLLAEALLQA